MRRLAFALLLSGCVAGCVSPQNDAHLQAVAKVHTELAAAYYERTQLGVALEELRKALQAEPGYAPAYSVRGLVHMALHEDKEAEDDFLHSLRLDSVNSDAHNNYGWFLCQRGREDESVHQFMDALKNPLYATPEKAYLNAGLCSMKAGKMQVAEEYLKQSLLLKPDLTEARLGLSKLYFANGDYIGAKANFMRFEQSQDADMNAENLWLAVRIERKLGDKDAEASYALQLRKRFPDARETLLMMQVR